MAEFQFVVRGVGTRRVPVAVMQVKTPAFAAESAEFCIGAALELVGRVPAVLGKHSVKVHGKTATMVAENCLTVINLTTSDNSGLAQFSMVE